MTTITQEPPAAQTNRRRKATGHEAEQYGALVHWLRSVADPSAIAPKAIGVTSCAAGTGVSATVHNLAVAAAESTNQAVLLLDLSGERSNPACVAHDEFSGQHIALCANIKATATPNLSVLSVADFVDPQALTIENGGIADLLRNLESEFGLILVDLPPVASSLCFVTAGLLGGVLLVMKSERTRSETAHRAKQRLLDARASVLGVILTEHRQHIPDWLDAKL